MTYHDFVGIFQLHCCGATNFRDWNVTNYYIEKGFPKSCCKVEDCSPQRDADKVNNEVRSLLKNVLKILTEYRVASLFSF